MADNAILLFHARHLSGPRRDPGTCHRLQTHSSGHIRRQREAHARSDGYGRHQHLYLHDTMRRLTPDSRF